MRESLLNDLYYGKIVPWERPRVCTHGFEEISDKIIDIEKHFKNLLPPEEYEKFEELQSLRGQAASIESAELFEYAFSTGVLMMIEVLHYKEND